jgi:hypothetical protein
LQPNEETLTTEITILPDGRVYVFGLSLQVLELLEDLSPRDPLVKKRLEALREEMQPDE